jgi:transposase-like protein
VRHWTAEENDYLQDKWGVISIKGIAKHLGRSVNAVKLKAQRAGLGDARMNFGGITVCQLGRALGREYSIMKNWITRYGMPAKRKIFASEHRVLIISYEDFWKWAEQHKELLNLAKLEPNLLGPEPDWAKTKRKADKMRSQRTWLSTAWTNQEDQRLLQLVRLPKITYPELAKQLNRSEPSIRRRLYDLNSKFLPARLSNHVKYTPVDVSILTGMATAGYGYETIAQKLGKSALGVRGKLERMGFDFKKRQFKDQNLEFSM